MRIGVILPSFAERSDEAVSVAKRAEEVGLDGVFCYDHLWPLGQPGRPAISPFPLLGAIAASTSKIAFGTLVARVGLEPAPVLESQLLSLFALGGRRFIAGLGTGDHKSLEENDAYGIPRTSAAERRAELALLTQRLIDRGVSVWIGGGSPRTNELARRSGAVLNLWAGSSTRMAVEADLGEVSWGGPLPGGEMAARAHVLSLKAAGVAYAVFTYPGSLEPLLAARSALSNTEAQ